VPKIPQTDKSPGLVTTAEFGRRAHRAEDHYLGHLVRVLGHAQVCAPPRRFLVTYTALRALKHVIEPDTPAKRVEVPEKGSSVSGVPYRRMRDAEFRRSQEAGVHLSHIAPVNELVDTLRTEGRGWVPYVAPLYGGVNAELLSVLRDPGPMTNAEEKGSGFLCLENDDAAAERFATLLAEAGIAASRMIPWNAYPWYINRKPNAAEQKAGLEPLRRLLGLLPCLRVVMLNGGDAQALWRRFAADHPALAEQYHVLPTYHTSRQAFIGTREVREARLAHLRTNFAAAARLLDGRT